MKRPRPQQWKQCQEDITITLYFISAQRSHTWQQSLGVGVGFNAPPDTISGHFRGGLHSQSLDWYWQTKQYRKIHRVNTTQTIQNTAEVSEQCFKSPPTQYRLYARRFLQVKRPNQQYQSAEGDATKEKENHENN